MTLLSSSESAQERRRRAALLMTEAMRRDVEEQRDLINARVRGETDAVYWERGFCAAKRSAWWEEHHRLVDQIQCSVLRVYFTAEQMRAEVERSRTLLGPN